MGSSGFTQLINTEFAKIYGIPAAPKYKLSKGLLSTSTSIEIKWQAATSQESGWEAATAYKIYISEVDDPL